MPGLPTIHATTILAARRGGKVAIGGDGQVTVGETVMKANANKVRLLKGNRVLAGFAGAAADALTLFDKFEEKLERYPTNLPRAAVELAKEWRSDRVAQSLAASARARKHPRRDLAEQHHPHRTHRRRKNGDRPQAGQAGGRAIRESGGLEVHGSGVRGARRRGNGARPGGQRHRHG